MTPHRLLLASGSPQRRELLREAGYRFEVVVPLESAECGACSATGPAALVAEFALKKALDVARQLAERPERVPTVLVACDTVAECGGTILGKPQGEDHAREMLTRLRGTVHRVVSGLCVFPIFSERAEQPSTQVAITSLKMDDVPDAEIEAYLATGLWEEKAGAFGLQDRPDWLHVESGSLTNVIGLPMELLAEMLTPWELA